jgi:molecular chaperone GrpE
MSKEADKPDQPDVPNPVRDTRTTGFSTNFELERLFQEAEQTIDKIVHAKRDSLDEPLPVSAPAPAAAEAPPRAGETGEHTEQLQREFERLKAQYEDLETDFRNFRDRTEREALSTSLNIRADLLRDLLQIIDVLELAANTFNSDKFAHTVESYQKGFNLLHRQFLDIFDKIGVTRIRAEAQPFDPQLHQAIAAEEKDNLTVQTNLKELKPGYIYHSILLRPAMVKVGIPKKKGG